MAIVNTDEHLGDTLMTHTRPHMSDLSLTDLHQALAGPF